MDRYQIASYLKLLRRKETYVWLGLVVVLTVMTTSFVWFWLGPRPTPLPIPSSTPVAAGSASTNLVLEKLPNHQDLKTTTTADGQVVPEGLPVKYRVQPGDSTWKIAQAFFGSGYNYVDIEQANHLRPDQDLEVGQELIIPQTPIKHSASVSSTPHQSDINDAKPTQSQTYTVVKGDSLWLIATRHYGHGRHWTTMYRQNRAVVGVNPDLIYPGQVIQL